MYVLTRYSAKPMLPHLQCHAQILGWRSTSTDEAEKKQDLPEDTLEDVKSPQEREYLVKWKGKAFRHVSSLPKHDEKTCVSYQRF
jgi:hypothetical protein